MGTRVFMAKQVVTMNPAQPFATHVAVRDGRILAVGGAADMADLGPTAADDRFASKVILPGFVEGHSHLHEGDAWRDPYLGFFDRRSPDGTVVPGLKSIEAAVERLRTASSGSNNAITAWGFDPIYFRGRRMNFADLDAVSRDLPVVVTHASGHIMNLNSAALRQAGLTRDTDLDGLVRDGQGELTGELLGPEAMGHIRRVVVPDAFGRRPGCRRDAALRTIGAIGRGHHRDRFGQRHVGCDRRHLSGGGCVAPSSRCAWCRPWPPGSSACRRASPGCRPYSGPARNPSISAW